MKISLFCLFLFIYLFLPAQEADKLYRIQFLHPEQNLPVERLSEKVSGNLYDSAAVYDFTGRLLSELHMNGYITASTESLVLADSIAFVHIVQGEQFRWGKLSLNYTEDVLKGRKVPELFLREGKIIEPAKILSDVRNILETFENNGYPFARIGFEKVNIAGGIVDAEITVKPLNRITIDSLIVKGDARIERQFIYRQTGIFPGSVYNQEAINRLGRSLNRLPYITFAREPGVEFRPAGADLYLFINRQRSSRFQGILGFLSDHRQSGKLVLNGDIQLGLINSFGKGEALDFAWKKTDLNNQEMDIGVQWPFLFGSPLALESRFHLFRFDTLYMNLDFRIAAGLGFGEAGQIMAFYESKTSNTIGAPGTFNLDDSQTRLYGLGYKFNSLNDFFNPRKGVSFSSTMAFGRRIRNVVNQRTQTSSRFDAGLDLAWFIPIARQSALLLMNRTALITLFEKGETVYLLDNELHRLGGINNIRGFDENSIQGSSFSIMTMEYRWLFERSSNVFLFTDLMYYRKNTLLNPTKDTPVGFGLGINLQTAAGMFTISYALGTQMGNPVEFRSAKVHLGYTSRF